MKKILLCEDDLVITELITNKLKENYDVSVAKNGKLGIELLEKSKFDLVITDIHMPYVTGLEVIDYVNEELTEKIPVLVLTKDISDETEEDAYEVGAEDYLTKPLKPNILMIKVKKILGDA